MKKILILLLLMIVIMTYSSPSNIYIFQTDDQELIIDFSTILSLQYGSYYDSSVSTVLTIYFKDKNKTKLTVFCDQRTYNKLKIAYLDWLERNE